MTTPSIDPRRFAAVATADTAATWSFNRHGPFHALQRRLGLLSDADLAAPRRALLFAALAWLPLLLLAALQGLAWNEQHQRALLFDFVAYAWAVAVAAFVLMEQTSDKRMVTLVGRFAAHDLVPESARADFARARVAMERRTGSVLAETVLLAAAYALSYGWAAAMVARVDGGSWAGRIDGGALQPTAAGWWLVMVT
jgi:hypothetical protein